MSQLDPLLLETLALKYIWWKPAHEAVQMPERIIAQVMNIGDYADVQAVSRRVKDDTLREILIKAEPGQFNDRSWAYWHYRLGLASPGTVPPLPKRKFT